MRIRRFRSLMKNAADRNLRTTFSQKLSRNACNSGILGLMDSPF